MTDTLFYGDNISILSQHIEDATVDLVYLDPPFDSNRDYNVLFREQSGKESLAQIKAVSNAWLPGAEAACRKEREQDA